MENATPAMRQYLEIKSRHKDAVLFFRMGDFYEMFYEDAELGARVMGVALTSRDREKKIPMCGVPYHAANVYISKLVKEGYKVAVCEQVEDPSEAKGVVERAVVRIITPGTAVEEELVDTKSNNYIASVLTDEKGVGLAFMDVATGDFKLADFVSHAAAGDELSKLSPSELLLPDGAPSNGFASAKTLSYSDRSYFVKSTAVEALKGHFKVATLEGYGCDESSLSVRAAGALLRYVKETQMAELNHVNRCSLHQYGEFVQLDVSTRRNLEIIENSRNTGKSGTLFGHLDRTSTPMGTRMLKSWLTYPLKDSGAICDRLETVTELMEFRSEREGLKRILDGCYDMERSMGKISVSLATPRDIVALKNSLDAAGQIKDKLARFSTRLVKNLMSGLDPVPEASALIARAIADNPPGGTRDGGFIRPGYSSELDELRSIGSGGKEWISSLEAAERQRTGINSLKVGYNRVFGYYIEITNAGLKNTTAPPEYIRKQTLANAERFVTPELKEWESKILNAEDKSKRLEIELYSELLDELRKYTGRVQASGRALATIDVLISYADVSEDYGYVRPDIDDSRVLRITDGRHPVIERTVADGFVPNDTMLDAASEQIVILTGPNMAGKSTFIRQVAIITLMAQAGCFVPAKKAEIGIVDKIFSRVGASDDMSKGHSTFMVEMNEAANILNNATDRSLVILDEIGRGTATFDGLSIAWAVVEYLHDTPGAAPRTLFATHYHELTELTLTKERVRNYNMAVKEWNDRIIFLKRVVPGGASRSYGIQVARLAGLPAAVIERAKEILRNLEGGELNEEGMPKLAGHGKTAVKNDARQQNLPLFSQAESVIVKRLMDVDVNRLTPVEALNELAAIRKMLDK